MSQDSLDQIIKSAEHKMNSAIEVLSRDLQSVRTGRASAALLDRIQVDYYGSPTPINGVANITAPEPRMVVVHPGTRACSVPIEKAIQKSDLGINPTNDGQVIRLVLPQLTQDRRKELVKQVHQRAEEARIAVRNCPARCAGPPAQGGKGRRHLPGGRAPRPGAAAEDDRPASSSASTMSPEARRPR